jgi:hypothetical protein
VAPTLAAFVHAKDWSGAARLILSRFEVFIHAVRGGEMSVEEAEPFEALTHVESSRDDELLSGFD